MAPSSDAYTKQYVSQMKAEKTHWQEDWTAERWREEWSALHQQNTVLVTGLRKMERDHAQVEDELRERSCKAEDRCREMEDHCREAEVRYREAENRRRELQARVKQLEEELQVIYNSRTWQLTRSYWRLMDGPAGSFLRPVRRLLANIWKGGRRG
jgi:SMC interacting uncharacterized protein involved in chromosome segregation